MKKKFYTFEDGTVVDMKQVVAVGKDYPAQKDQVRLRIYFKSNSTIVETQCSVYQGDQFITCLS